MCEQLPLESWIINDNVHGHISLPGLLRCVADTCEFQRLRDIKQLGPVEYVYPGASHNRFEHSLGVAHLAGRWVTRLQQRQPELGITTLDTYCVQLAALIHDLGHGPWSHVFDSMFIPLVLPDSSWSHEQGSALLFDLLLERNPEVQTMLELHGVGVEQVHLIKEIVFGSATAAPAEWVWRGYPGKEFLFDIVSNDQTGIDVDKFDYFVRDCHHVGLACAFDANRLMEYARVMPTATGRLTISFPVKEMWNVYQLFYMRFLLHKCVYKHKTVRAISLMAVEAWSKYDNGSSLSATIDDMSEYVNLTDFAVRDVDPKFIRNLQVRKLYRMLGEVVLADGQSTEDARTALCASHGGDFPDSMLVVDVANISYGAGNANPLLSVSFFDRDRVMSHGDLAAVTRCAPTAFTETIVRLYVKSEPEPHVCCSCGDRCNEASQMCGHCMRRGWM